MQGKGVFIARVEKMKKCEMRIEDVQNVKLEGGIKVGGEMCTSKWSTGK